MGDGGAIVAPATPPGRSALAVIRLSGPATRSILKSVFQPRRARRPWLPWSLRVGQFIDPATSHPFDEGTAVWMESPNSYTGEDMAELTCHGGPLIVELLLSACIRQGAILADPGEFTRRAFLNGKKGLAEAEAVADVIAAETGRCLEAARRQLSGELSRRVVAIREGLVNLSAEIEARIDFPEEGIPEEDRIRLVGLLVECQSKLEDLQRHSVFKRRLREGARVAFVGKVNVGKSSLFNALIGMERAIASPHPGTTRDTIEARVEIGGIAVDLIDTAGIRGASDEVEDLGIQRTKDEIGRSDCLVWVVDRSQIPSEEDGRTLSMISDKQFILTFSKSDLSPALTDRQWMEWMNPILPFGDSRIRIQSSCVLTSAQERHGLRELEESIRRNLLGDAPDGVDDETLATNLRHLQCLREASEALSVARTALESRVDLELVSLDLRIALDRLSSILGIEVGEDVLNRIFSKFCIGK